MDKLKEAIKIILETELEDTEKLAIIARLANTTTDEEMTSVISEVADFLDASAAKYEQQSNVYEKYKDMAAKMDEEIKQIKETPLENFRPNPSTSTPS